MNFREAGLPGVLTIELVPHEDERGSFARLWAEELLAERGLDAHMSQASIARNEREGTLRGMHWQVAPHAETKVVGCVSGAVHDVVVDLRPGSETFGRWTAVELTAAGGRLLYVPKGFAHGYQTLQPRTTVLYFISSPYVPEAARGFRWDDPAFGIEWPEPGGLRTISERDASWPPYALEERLP